MAAEIFITSFIIILMGMLWWGFRHLPAEKWQVMCCVPMDKTQDGLWRGRNLTYYGFFNATACLMGVGLMVVLIVPLSVPLGLLLVFTVIVLMICIPTSRFIARIVENKLHTSTIGGAFFAGLLTAPMILWLLNGTVGLMMGFHLPALEILAAMMIAYTVGEGVGRLGCISFGCCYGRILDQSNPFLRKLFKRWTFVFEGETKKIAYAHHYDSLPVIPVQRLTVIIFTASAVVGCYFFLKGYAGAVLAGLTVTTQGWRFMSEYLRADYRGKGKITVYQGMAAASIPYVFFLIAFMSPSVRVSPDIMRGLQALWTPGVIIFLELLWWAVFLYTGRSNVTESQIAVYVLRDKI